MDEMSYPILNSVLLLTFNFVSAIATIVLNKMCFDHTSIPPSALSVLHYVFTYFALFVLSKYGVFVPSEAPLDRQLVSLAILTSAGLGLSNASLRFNSLWLYQILKILVTPCVALLEFLWYKQVIRYDRSISLLVVCLGVYFASISTSSSPTSTAAPFNWVGVLSGLSLLPIAAIYKVQWSALQKYYGWDTLTLMYAVLPTATAFLLCVSLITEFPTHYPPVEKFINPLGMSLIVLSSVGAFFVNWSCFLVLGKISALAHVLLGQFKTCAVVVIAFLFYDGSSTSSTAIVGAVLALVAMSYFSF
eukprot:PhF_6_TR41566/c0_g1_i1/m.62976/K15285/SLC35E3; solute carrier family 35, member E3